MYKAAIFDLDGTLVDSLPDIASAANSGLKHIGLRTFTVQEYKSIAGGGHWRLMTKAITLAQGGIPPTEEQLMRSVNVKKKQENSPNGHDHTRPFNNIHNMLSTLQEHGMQLAILSNKNEATVRQIVARLFPDIKFRHVAGARNDVPLKPDPTAAIRIVNRVFAGLRSAEVLYVGDTDIDMRTAVTAGLTPIAVPWGCRTADELYANGAAVVVRKPDDILKIALRNSNKAKKMLA